MSSATRWLVALAGAASLGWLGSVAITAGSAGTVGWYANRYLETGGQRREPAALEDHRERVSDAVRRAPGDGRLQELAALLELRSTGKGSADVRAHLERSLMSRPSSPYTWANLAAELYRSGETGRHFVASLEHAVELGPFEPEVQATVAFYGLAVWDEVGIPTRHAIESMVASGMKRNPMEMLQISQRRGRLEIACRHLDGIPRQTDPKSLRLCQNQIREDMS